MPTENDTGERSQALSAMENVRGKPAAGVRAWLLENYRLIYFLNLVAAYSFLILFSISLFLFGKPMFVSKVFLAIFIGSAIIAALPWVEFGRGNPARTRRVLSVRRSPRAARIGIVLAAVVWGAIALVIAAVLLGLRISRG